MQDDLPNKKSKRKPPSSGINFMGAVNAPGSQFAGNDIYNNQTNGIPWQEIESLFTPLIAAVHQAPTEIKAQAEATTDEIKNEVAKGDKANDHHLSALLEKLLALVPGAASVVASTFAQPMLAGLAGPLTKALLSKLGLP
jgi:hypothetical protein